MPQLSWLKIKIKEEQSNKIEANANKIKLIWSAQRKWKPWKKKMIVYFGH